MSGSDESQTANKKSGTCIATITLNCQLNYCKWLVLVLVPTMQMLKVNYCQAKDLLVMYLFHPNKRGKVGKHLSIKRKTKSAQTKSLYIWLIYTVRFSIARKPTILFCWLKKPDLVTCVVTCDTSLGALRGLLLEYSP